MLWSNNSRLMFNDALYYRRISHRHIMFSQYIVSYSHIVSYHVMCHRSYHYVA